MDALHAMGIPVKIWTVRSKWTSGFRSSWTRPCGLRSAVCLAILAGVVPGGPGDEALSQPLPWKGQSGAFLLGSFDLAATRFSGRTAPLMQRSHNVARYVMQEAYSNEECSCAFGQELA